MTLAIVYTCGKRLLRQVNVRENLNYTRTGCDYDVFSVINTSRRN